MYQFSYADIQTDSVADAKDRERQLLSRSIDLLTTASSVGTNSMEAIEALPDAWKTVLEMEERAYRLPGLRDVGEWLLASGTC